MKKQKVQLWVAATKLLNGVLMDMVLEVLEDTGMSSAVLTEGDNLEVTKENITMSFTWDMITIVNNDTNEVLTTMDNPDEYKCCDFFSKAINTNPDSCEYCPFVLYTKSTDNEMWCIARGQLYDKRHKCDVAPIVLKKMIKRRF